MAFEFAGGVLFEDGKAEGFCVRDGQGFEKFRGVYRLHADALHGLAARRARVQVGLVWRLPVIKAIAAKAAGGGGGNVAVDGHGERKR